MIRVSRRSLVCVVSTVLAVGAVTACEPPPPPPSLVVTTTGTGPDSSPGDGICEMTTGAGDCSFEAAIQEGNALGRASIELAAGEYPFPAVTITGDLSVTGSGTHLDVAFTSLAGGPITVAPQGRLTLDSLTSSVQLSVEGLLVGRRLYLFWPSGPTHSGPHVEIRAGGVALLHNTILPGILGEPALHNRGVLGLNHSTLFRSIQGATPLHNEGTVHSTASYLEGCSGTPPISHGYNAAPDDSCGLDAPTDLPFATGVAVTGSFRWYFFMYTLRSDSPLLDAIPAGVNGCGTTVADDLERRVRPIDGDGDGTAGCDVGALEITP